MNYTYKSYSNIKSIKGLINYLKNDKKNNDEKINFILLKKIGKTTKPNSYKISIKDFKKILSTSLNFYFQGMYFIFQFIF